MIKLQNIKKDYKVADTTVHALKGININFREAEFVSILGPSGCGKTTLLNILGGLDHATSGDLVIDNTSTKEYKDRDWDTYRNHRVGFVFQSYNLIPHQNILENVELALNIAGFKKEERIKKAKLALDKVGLKGLYHKKPNQISGGQCQRVAIARALVNDPEILLADEPTGALDSTTSIQIMDLIKEISKETLVIMVTHNQELAEKYSTRVIKLLDGNVMSDSNPFDTETEVVEKVKSRRKTKKSRLTFGSTFKLSGRNLWSKLKRTLMVCLAGSIGIIGVASVCAVSNGTTNYINNMQNDMLSGNPVTISESGYNMDSLMNLMSSFDKEDVHKQIKEGYINVEETIENLAKRDKDAGGLMINNDITQTYIDYLREMPTTAYASFNFDYGINIENNIFTDVSLEKYNSQTISLIAIKNIYMAILQQTDLSQYSALVTGAANTFQQLPESKDFVLGQYDILTGDAQKNYPTEANEITLVVNPDNELSNLFLAELGYFSQEEFLNIIYKATEDEKYDPLLDKERLSYQELLGKTFTYYPNNTVFTTHLEDPSPFDYSAYKNPAWTTGTQLKITSILIPKEGLNYGCLSTGFYYTSAFTQKFINDNKNSDIVKYLIDNNKDGTPNTNITYKFSYFFDGVDYVDTIGYVGTMSTLNAMMGGAITYNLSVRELGGKIMPKKIEIYALDFETKDAMKEYLDDWNSDKTLIINGVEVQKDARSEIKYADNLAVVMSMVGNLTSIVTIALIAFTALSLVVSTVMIAIITYVSVIERIKEIGVIRSLGGRKKDVSRLFIVESGIIGGVSGVLGIVVTAILTIIINIVAGVKIAILTVPIIVIMIAVSILLTLISGLIPARLASRKDPVVALRSE